MRASLPPAAACELSVGQAGTSLSSLHATPARALPLPHPLPVLPPPSTLQAQGTKGLIELAADEAARNPDMAEWHAVAEDAAAVARQQVGGL